MHGAGFIGQFRLFWKARGSEIARAHRQRARQLCLVVNNGRFLASPERKKLSKSGVAGFAAAG